MSRLYNVLNKMAQFVASPIQVINITDSQQTLAGYGGLTRDLSLSSHVPSGYEAVMATLRGTGSYACYPYYCGLNTAANVVTYQIGNRDSASKTVTPSITVLCVKTV